eukprot:jgi/Galph1/2553/GphlegSOOS_G1217.1
MGHGGVTRRRYKYEVWPANNKFFCGGKVITGPDYKNTFVTILLVVIPLGLYYGITISYLVSHWRAGAYTFLALTAFLAVVSLGSLLLTALDDPGIIPRQSVEPRDVIRNPRTGFPLPKEIVLNGHQYTLKYCGKCYYLVIWRPLRASHCSTCNNCVQRFDHHCPWLGNCIGRRNYRTFYIFIFSTTVLCILVIASASVSLRLKTDAKSKNKSDSEAFGAALGSPLVISFILIIYCLAACLFTGGLFAFHTILIFRNRTTAETLKYSWKEVTTLEPRGIHSFYHLICEKKPPSQIKVRDSTGRTISPLFGVTVHQTNDAKMDHNGNNNDSPEPEKLRKLSQESPDH